MRSCLSVFIRLILLVLLLASLGLICNGLLLDGGRSQVILGLLFGLAVIGLVAEMNSRSASSSSKVTRKPTPWTQPIFDQAQQNKQDKQQEEARRQREEAKRKAIFESVNPMASRLLCEAGDAIWGRSGRSKNYKVEHQGHEWWLSARKSGPYLCVALVTPLGGAEQNHFVVYVNADRLQGYQDEYETQPILIPEQQDWLPLQRTQDISESALKEVLGKVLWQFVTHYNLDQHLQK